MADHALDTRPLRILHLALVGGTLAFAAVVAVMAALGVEQPLPAGTDLLRRLSLLDALVFAGAAPAALLVPARMARRVPLDDPALRSRGDDARAELRRLALGRVTTAHLVRLALLEGSALLGLLVCLLAVLGGVAGEQPVWLLNALPAAVLLAVGIVTFPSRDRIEMAVERAVRG